MIKCIVIRSQADMDGPEYPLVEFTEKLAASDGCDIWLKLSNGFRIVVACSNKPAYTPSAGLVAALNDIDSQYCWGAETMEAFLNSMVENMHNDRVNVRPPSELLN